MEKDFNKSFSGADWAKAFMETWGHRKEEIDESVMLAWFCNAIMRGYDERSWQINDESARP